MMSALPRASFIRATAVFLGLGMCSCSKPVEEVGTLRASEAGLRSIAIRKRDPTYPEASIRLGSTGVAVAAIRVAKDGRVAKIEVLQAPDSDIEIAIHNALMQWRFDPPHVDGSSKSHEMEGKLTYYFRIRDGHGVVEVPATLRAASGTGATHRGWMTDDEALLDVDARTAEVLYRSGRGVIVDVRARDEFAKGHRESSVNIPADELTHRAVAELPRGAMIIIDCTRAASDICRAAGSDLRRIGFADVRALQGGSVPARGRGGASGLR